MPTPYSCPGDRKSPPHRPAPFSDDLLFGRLGLRAGWGILLFCLLFGFIYIVVPVFTQPAQSALQTSSSRAAFQIAAPPYLLTEGLIFAGLVLTSWFLAHLEGRLIGVYGICSRRRRDFLPGAFWGLACMSLLIAALHGLHLLAFDTRVLHGRAIFLSGILWLATFLIVGLFEEYLFRGYLLFTLTRGLFGLGKRLSPRHARAIAFWIAAIFMSIVFALFHLFNSGETRFGLGSVFLAGIVFTYALWRTGSLWWAIGFHMMWDWAQSFLYGVPDSGGLSVGRLFQTHPTGNPLLSGGTVGPEGSVFLIPIVMIIALVIRFTASPGTQPSLEPQTRQLDELSDTSSAVS